MSARYGGLMELAARGKKDVFFTANPQISFFHSIYTCAAPFTKEIYETKPTNIPEWGKWVDFDIEHRGDIVKYFYLRIQLPSWLPPAAVAANQNGLVSDKYGVTYGWCNNIGYQMIKKIQVFQDQVLVHESYGEYMDWRLRQSYSLAKTYITGSEIGAREETPLALGRSASPRLLRVPIPFLGWQHLDDPGFPTAALRDQRYRIRIHLQPLQSVVMASDGRLYPEPWGGKTLRIQTTPGGPYNYSEKTLPVEVMKDLGITLETTQFYLPPDVITWMKAQTIRFPYFDVKFNQFTIEDNQMTAAANGSTVSLPFNIDFDGSIERMLIGFRTAANNAAGDRTNLTSPAGGALASTLRLNIANINRIQENPVSFAREFTAYWKNARLALNQVDYKKPLELYTLTFGGFDDGQPQGTVNFTRAVLPVLYVIPAAVPYDRRNVSRQTIAYIYGESWNIWEISGGRGKAMLDD